MGNNNTLAEIRARLAAAEQKKQIDNLQTCIAKIMNKIN